MDHERPVMRRCGALRPVEGPRIYNDLATKHAGLAESHMEQPEPSADFEPIAGSSRGDGRAG
jgi:hypothetical protein